MKLLFERRPEVHAAGITGQAAPPVDQRAVGAGELGHTQGLPLPAGHDRPAILLSRSRARPRERRHFVDCEVEWPWRRRWWRRRRRPLSPVHMITSRPWTLARSDVDVGVRGPCRHQPRDFPIVFVSLLLPRLRPDWDLHDLHLGEADAGPTAVEDMGEGR